MRRFASTWAFAWATSFFLVVCGPNVSNHPAARAADEVDEELARQQAIIDRFLTVLEKNPRRGTALDRIYGFYVENGQINELVAKYAERAKQDEADGVSWMIIGLVESQRGRDAAAVEAFRRATEIRTDDALAPYYLGQSLVLVGQPDEAVKAFELAISRKPPPNDLLPVFQALGRVHQRAQRSEEALKVWTRLEELFPGDVLVKEQIAATMVEEGQFADALSRYQSLATLTKDDYRRSVYQIEAADLLVKLNRGSEGVAMLEALLASLNPDGWLHRDVRRRIEDIFLRTEDNGGLAKYYEGWLEKNPEDVDAMARLARVLARQARLPEAQQWLEKALKLAPSRNELRLTFIRQLVEDRRFAEAIAQYELLDRNEPNNPDYLREWGKLVLRDSSRPKEERQAAAAKVWQRIVDARPNDALAATQGADLFRHADMAEQALALYQRATELAPSQPQYREYLGEYYHQLKRTDEAIATWREIAAGKNRTAANLARLAEVLASFGHLDLALPEIEEATSLDPKDFNLAMTASSLYSKAEKYDEALAYLDSAKALAQNEAEHEQILQAQINVYRMDDSLARRADELAKQATGEPTFENWRRLARLYQADRRYAEAKQAIVKALDLQPKSVTALSTAARIAEDDGSLEEAADTYRKLAITDRRARGEHLQRVATLEAQLGRPEQAMEAGRELIASAPGATANYEFFSDLCLQLGKEEEGLEALRRAIRINPTDPRLPEKLGDSLARLFRTDEAIELYWNAWEKAPELDDKVGLIGKLTDLYLQINHFDRLLERLERLQSDATDKREATICLAQAYHSAGDFGMARQELESLMSETTRDTQLIQQLSKLAEAEGDMAAALKYQRQLADLAPGAETEYRLATLLEQQGETQEANAILVRLSTREDDEVKFFRNVDALLGGQQHDTAAMILEARLREDPKNWELLYRSGVAHFHSKRPVEAKERFRAILELPVDDTDPGAAVRSRKDSSADLVMLSRMNAVDAAKNAAEVKITKPEMIGYSGYGNPSRRRFWSPDYYHQARIGALAWLYRLAEEEGTEAKFAEPYRNAALQSNATDQEIWDCVYLSRFTTSLSGKEDDAEQIYNDLVRRLAKAGDPTGRILFLINLAPRNQNNQRSGKQNEPKPLGEEDLALLREIYATLDEPKKKYPLYPYYLTRIVAEELARAGHTDEAAKIREQMIASATGSDLMHAAIVHAGVEAQRKVILKWFDRWAATASGATGAQPNNSHVRVADTLAKYVGREGAERRHDEVLAILDHYLDFNRKRAVQASSAPRRRNSRSQQRNIGFAVYYGADGSYFAGQYPFPNEYLDIAAFQLLRNVFEIFKRNGAYEELERRLEARLEGARPSDKVFEQLALAYVSWWNEDKEKAVERIIEAAKLAPDSAELVLDAAQFQTELGNPSAALELIDSITPLDQEVMRDREIMALNLSVRLGQHSRARKAAERLFGLRLDTATQLQLATAMQQLGMHEHADAILTRAQRQAGSRTNTLLSLLAFYQSQGKHEIAQQIAYQLLRRTRTRPSGAASRGYTQEDQARQAALQALGAAGKLKELIAQSEEQLKRTPNAVQVLETLSEYYRAAGDQAKALEIEARIVETRSEDPAVIYNFAKKLSAAGKHAEACENYLRALRKQPALMRNEYWEVTQAFQQARKDAELVDFLNEIDLKTLGQSYVVTNIVQNLLNDESKWDQGLALFRRAWETFPNERQTMMRSLYNESLWQRPEVLEYGRQLLIPTKETPPPNPYFGIDQVSSYSGEGRPNTPLRYVLNALASSNQLPGFQKDLKLAIDAFPDWKAGPLIAAAVDARLGNVDAARAAVKAVMEADKEIPHNSLWIIGYELEGQKELIDVVTDLYERASRTEDQNLGLNFNYTVNARLIKIHADAGRKDEARRLLLESVKSNRGQRNVSDPSWIAEEQLTTAFEAARLSAQLNFTTDSVRFYQEALNLANRNAAANLGWNTDYYRSAAEQGLQQALAKFAQQASGDPDSVIELLIPETAEKESRNVELLPKLTVTPHGLLQLESTVLELIGLAKFTPEVRASARERLASLIAAAPDDLHAHVLLTCLALEEAEPDVARSALDGLWAAIEKAPPAESAESETEKPQGQVEAARHVALWFVAEKCLAKPEFRDDGVRFARHALNAARQLDDPKFSAALLFENGNAALARGEKAEAATYWTELLKTAIRGASKEEADGESLDPKQPLTVEQFRTAAGVAHLAAQHGMEKLAIAALKASLARGMPVAQITIGQGDRRGIAALGAPTGYAAPVAVNTISTFIDADVNDSQGITQLVITRLQAISGEWRSRNLPAEEIYRVLRDVVAPPDRPDTVVFGDQRLDWNTPRSLARELALWAVAAKRTDELRAELSKRQSQPLAAPAAASLSLLMSLESKDFDQARLDLATMGQLLTESRPSAMINIMCHSLSPAVMQPELEDDAAPVVAAVLERIEKRDHSHVRNPYHILIRNKLKHRDREAAEKLIADFLAVVQASSARYSGDYGPYLQRQELGQLADICAEAGETLLAVNLLGQYLDIPARPRYFGAREPDRVFARLHEFLSELPADERYTLMRDWTLPAGGRRSLRLLQTFVVPRVAPSVLGKANSQHDPTAPSSAVASNFTWLVDAAKEIGALDELAVAAKAAENEKIPHAGTLALTVSAARGELDPAQLSTRLEQAESRLKSTMTPGSPVDLSIVPMNEDYALWAALQAVPETRALRTRLGFVLGETRRYQYQADTAPKTNGMMAEDIISVLSPEERVRARGLDLRYWRAATPPGANDGAEPAAWWAANEGHVAHITGHPFNSLFFEYPLTGEFEFSCDAYLWNNHLAQPVYGGLCVAPAIFPDHFVEIAPIGRHERLGRPGAVDRNWMWVRYSIRARPGKISFYLNDHLVHEDLDPSPTSPWLHLTSPGSRWSIFRNPKISGQPQIPREVALSHANRLTGWTAEHFGKRIAPELMPRETFVMDDGKPRYYDEVMQPRPADWKSEDGVIIGRYDSGAAGANSRSLLRYHRPLLPGDTLRYEFFYRPGNVMVHPALGAIAFLLEPDGVKLHWMARAVDVGGQLSPREVMLAPNAAGAVPLIADDWNTVELSRDERVVRLSLNGQEIYQHEIAPHDDTRFGLFHYMEDSEAKVRNVVLTGDWPESLDREVTDNLLARASEASPEFLAIQSELIGEERIVESVYDVWRAGQSLSPQERFEWFANWVLPGETHGTYRLQSFLTPHAPGDGSGGKLKSPALELVGLAVELKKTDDLAQRIDAAAQRFPADSRNILALRTLLAIARNDSSAQKGIEELRGGLKSIAPQVLPWARHSELVVAHAAMERPELREAALALAVEIASNQPSNPYDLDWDRIARWARARAERLHKSEPIDAQVGALAQSKQWTSVVHASAETHGKGHPMPAWRVEEGAADFLTGHWRDSLYFNVPLRGDFEVRCRRSTYGWREMRLLYAGAAFDVTADGSSLFVDQFGQNRKMQKLPEKVADWGEWADFRMVVKDGVLTTFINGMKVSSDTLGDEWDPWLAIQSGAPEYAGGVRDLRVIGTPEIPESLNLSAGTRLAGWNPDYYAGTFEGERPTWKKDGAEIVSGGPITYPGSFLENLLYYHRPIVEDGQISYEFFWSPGKYEVHPALGRAAVLVSPEGVALHRLTAASYERTGLLPDNKSPLPAGAETAAPDLKGDDWNRLTLDIKGDVATLTVNDRQVARWKLDPHEQRFFGFFHYRDQTTARVRNVIYRGDWPKSLPPVEQQDLAAPAPALSRQK